MEGLEVKAWLAHHLFNKCLRTQNTTHMDPLKKISFLILLAGFLPFTSVNAQELGMYIEQYEGQSGTRTFEVKLLRIGEKSNEEVLMKVSGVDDPLNGQIYKYKKEWQSSAKHLEQYIYVTTQVPGKERIATFHADKQSFKVYLLDEPMKAISIYPAQYQSNLDPNFMYEQYLQQQEKRAKE